MAMSELKQKLLVNELAKAGYPDAVYVSEFRKPDGITEPDRIMINPNDSRMPEINSAGDIQYAKEYHNLAVDTVRPIVSKVNEIIGAWDLSEPAPFENLAQFRVLAEYNGVMLAARDDTMYGRGLNFVTWQYNYDRTGLDNGHYTEDYNAAKEDFAKRSGLIAEAKLFSPEQAAELKESLDYRIKNDGDIEFAKEIMLKGIAEKLNKAYPEKKIKEENGVKSKRLEEKLKAAREKTKARDAQGNKAKTKKREERD